MSAYEVAIREGFAAKGDTIAGARYIVKPTVQEARWRTV
jgi:hypothetical protein